MKYHLFLRTREGISLEVMQELPQKGDQFPTVLMVPGFGMDLHEYGLFDQISQALIRNGWQTVRFSFTGCGKSGGDFVSATLNSLVDQFQDILTYTVKDRFTLKNRIGAIGQSFGGVVIAAALPLPLKSIIFTSVPSNPYTTLSDYFIQQKGFYPNHISSVQRSDGRITDIGSKFWQSILGKHVSNYMHNLTQPIKFIYGTDDTKLDLTEAKKVYDAVKVKKSWTTIPKANHGFTGKSRQKLLDHIIQWIRQTL